MFLVTMIASRTSAFMVVIPVVNLEPEVLERIRRYKRNRFLQKAKIYAPLLAGGIGFVVAIAVVSSLGRNLFVESIRARDGIGEFIGMMVPFMLSIIACWLPLGSGSLPGYSIGDDKAVSLFRNALEGVSVAVGLAPPELVVIDVPTANSIAYNKGRNAAVGVTVEALVSDLTTQNAESMMAHELSHIIMGDVYRSIDVNKIVYKYLPVCFTLFCLPVFGAFVTGEKWIFWVAMVSWSPFTLYWMYRQPRFLYRQDDLLADSIAARITYNPAALRKTIEKIGDLYLESKEPLELINLYAAYMFVHRVRPEVVISEQLADLEEEVYGRDEEEGRRQKLKEKIVKWDRFPATTVERRIENLEAIERGFWLEFEYSKKKNDSVSRV